MGDDSDFDAVVIPASAFDATPETVDGCMHLARALFNEIETRFGEPEARRIFNLFGKPPRIPRHELKKLEVIGLYWSMKPCPSKQRLARELAEKNKTLAAEDRYGPGTTEMSTFRMYIHRAVKEQEQKSPNMGTIRRTRGLNASVTILDSRNVTHIFGA
jgi:hypothetical protein